ncbi:MAG: 2-dehydropantoate 2-reductase [Anaerolineales bacterium]
MASLSQPRLLILGTGALATLFAARLAAAGTQICLLGSWPAGLEALNREGARLILPDGREIRQAVRAIATPEEAGQVENALVLVKAWQTERAAQQLKRCLAPNGLALTLQNGLGNREILSAVLGAERVALGVTTLGATLLGPGLARSGGEGLLSLEAHPRLAGLESLLRAADFPLEILPDAAALAWGKLVINSAINPLTALLQISNGELLQRRGARALMTALARETAQVAQACGVRLPFENPAQAAETVAKKTAANRSSMFQDVRRGAPTEIDAICGAVVRAAQSKGLSAPVNWVMWQLLAAQTE